MAEIHRIAGGNVNCYIVAHKDQAILIDTGRMLLTLPEPWISP